jgi:hypothetical protein
MSNQSEAASVLCKPIGVKHWPIAEHRENCNSLADCYLHISKYYLVHCRPDTWFYGVCRTYPNFFYFIPILCRFRIIICMQQAALLSGLFNYTPLVIRRSDKNKQLTIIKPTQTGTNFLLSKIIGAPKKFKTQARPLVRSSYVNFCQYFWNLSHETVPLKHFVTAPSICLTLVLFIPFTLGHLTYLSGALDKG